MSFDVKIIADSQGRWSRLTTMQLRYPRFIHAEFMTHRVFSRNASSSRAIPVAKMIEAVRTDPAMPIHWGKNQPGMQANEELDRYEREKVEGCWRLAALDAARMAEEMQGWGAHKQIVNRILEPFLHISVVVTSTEWDNFFALRCHKDAQPEIRRLAEWMREALHHSVPRKMKPGDWHLPYCQPDGTTSEIDVALKASVARCARVSYNKHDGTAPNVEEDLSLHDRLVGSHPRHSSPAEHQAMMDLATPFEDFAVGNMNGNLAPEWVQYRKVLEKGVNPTWITEHVRNYEP